MLKSILTFGFVVVATITKAQLTAQTDSVKQATDSLITPFDFSALTPVELPMPNSWNYSYEQAGKRKHEIYNLVPTPKYFGWKNPTSGGAVHINKNDEIEVYQFTYGIYLYRNDTGVFFSPAPIDTFIVLKDIKELHNYTQGIGYGNPASVLITAEISLYKSESIKKLLGELWAPGIQIYYLKQRDIKN